VPPGSNTPRALALGNGDSVVAATCSRRQ
jgi:hypothetical protein